MQNTIASKLERSNVTALRNAVDQGKTPTMWQEWTWYVDAEVAPADRHDFQLYWIDIDTNERGKVVGETGYEWLEVHEVAGHFNAEGTGDFFYVGLSTYDGGVAPNWSELRSVIAYAERSGERPIQEWYTYSDWLAAYILFKTSPKLNLHKRNNWA
jgi:hypothetical protein